MANSTEYEHGYESGVKAAAHLLAQMGMDDGPKHFARSVLKRLLAPEHLPHRRFYCHCSQCGWQGERQEDTLPNLSIYCPNCLAAVMMQVDPDREYENAIV